MPKVKPGLAGHSCAAPATQGVRRRARDSSRGVEGAGAALRAWLWRHLRPACHAGERRLRLRGARRPQSRPRARHLRGTHLLRGQRPGMAGFTLPTVATASKSSSQVSRVRFLRASKSGSRGVTGGPRHHHVVDRVDHAVARLDRPARDLGAVHGETRLVGGDREHRALAAAFVARFHVRGEQDARHHVVIQDLGDLRLVLQQAAKGARRESSRMPRRSGRRR